MKTIGVRGSLAYGVFHPNGSLLLDGSDRPLIFFDFRQADAYAGHRCSVKELVIFSKVKATNEITQEKI